MTRERLSAEKGFTILEVLIATIILVSVAGGTFLLFGGVSKFQSRRGHQYEAFEAASQTLDMLKNYVTPIPLLIGPDPMYHLDGDVAGPSFWALDPGPPDPHRHPLPAGVLRDQLGGQRRYSVNDVDLDGDGNYDYKQVTVTITWTEPP